VTTTTQLDFGIAPQRSEPDRIVDRGSSVEADACPETFSLDSQGRVITRRMRLRDARVAASSLPLIQVPRKKKLDQAELAALADVNFLRCAHWPGTKADVPAVRVADLFSGCGVMSLGVWEAARAVGRRMEPAVALDVSLCAIDVYKHNFPDATALPEPIENYLDGEIGKPATEAEKAFVASTGVIDLLIGGPPCQGHSNLNNHTRRDDPKNRLYARMARFAELVGPSSIIVENVSAVLHDRGRVVDHTIAVLLRLGYKVDHAVAEVSALGVAQRRRRHIMMASLDKAPDVRRTLALYAREARSVEWAIGDLAPLKTQSPFDTASNSSRENQKRMAWLFEHDKYELPDRLRPDCHKLKEHSYSSVYGRMHWGKPSQTITSGFTSMGQGRYVHPSEPRTITPHEAARLQFIPDFFTFGEQTPRTALSEMIGNAVPTKLSYVLAVELLR
jgi:DNA (cytosine-5)-methyltransferase 1